MYNCTCIGKLVKYQVCNYVLIHCIPVYQDRRQWSGGRWGDRPSDFGRSFDPIPTGRGQIMPTSVLLAPPDFQIFLRPCVRVWPGFLSMKFLESTLTQTNNCCAQPQAKLHAIVRSSWVIYFLMQYSYQSDQGCGASQ